MERNILGYKCRGCGQIFYPNRSRCRKCPGTEFDPVPLPKNGVLLTFTRLFNPPGDFEVPYIDIGIVELKGGNRIMGQLKVKHAKIGMKVAGKVEVVRQLDYTTSYGMVFYDE